MYKYFEIRINILDIEEENQQIGNPEMKKGDQFNQQNHLHSEGT